MDEKFHNQQPPVPQKKGNPFLWVFTTYFAEGFPFVLIRTVSPFFFRAGGLSLEATGLTSLYGLPWVLKFLWAPFLDSYGTKRDWLLLSQALLVFFFASIALLCPFSGAVPVLFFLFFAASIVAATHDVAIDGYYLEALNKEGQSKFVGYRVMAYRIAMMFGSGVVVTIGALIGWFWAFCLSAVVFGGLVTYHRSYLPKCEKEKKTIRKLVDQFSGFRFVFFAVLLVLAVILLFLNLQTNLFSGSNSITGFVGLLLLFSLFVLILLRRRLMSHMEQHSHSTFPRAFLTFIDREKITAVILFILFVRAGEFMLAAMVSPFFIDMGFGDHYGWITGAVGLPCSIIGAMAGGWLISRFGLGKMIWPFLLAQNFTNLTYMSLASFLVNRGSTEMMLHETGHLVFIAAVTAFDHIAGGLGTAVLMTFLMGLCARDFKAAHYAIGTGLMSVSGVYAGAFSGFLVGWFGYALFFAVSFLFSVPGMVLIFFLPLNKKSP